MNGKFHDRKSSKNENFKRENSKIKTPRLQTPEGNYKTFAVKPVRITTGHVIKQKGKTTRQFQSAYIPWYQFSIEFLGFGFWSHISIKSGLECQSKFCYTNFRFLFQIWDCVKLLTKIRSKTNTQV